MRLFENPLNKNSLDRAFLFSISGLSECMSFALWCSQLLKKVPLSSLIYITGSIVRYINLPKLTFREIVGPSSILSHVEAVGNLVALAEP